MLAVREWREGGPGARAVCPLSLQWIGACSSSGGWRGLVQEAAQPGAFRTRMERPAPAPADRRPLFDPGSRHHPISLPCGPSDTPPYGESWVFLLA